MSRVVLGGGSFAKMNFSELCNLLNHAYELGIRRIDTAPLYGDSEEKIGRYFGKYGHKDWKISTKVGMPIIADFNPEGIKKQLNQSLKKLRLEHVDSVFIHSLPYTFLSHENISTLQGLKITGKTSSFGYSGDNADLRMALNLHKFDAVMSTFNPLDMGNQKTIAGLKQNQQLVLKRALANAIWDNSQSKKLKAIARHIKHPLKAPSAHPYTERLKLLKEVIPRNATAYFRFSFSCFPNALVILGISKEKHLVELMQIEQYNYRFELPQILSSIAEFERVSSQERWEVLT